MKLISILTAVITVVSLTACAVNPVGDSYGSTAPKLTRIDNILGWDNPSNFGPVPADKAAAGASTCAMLPGGDYKATGFHPSAKAENGQTLVGGGYYCTR